MSGIVPSVVKMYDRESHLASIGEYEPFSGGEASEASQIEDCIQ